MSKHNLLQRISIMDFMLRDLGLYLNTNPTDQKALALHNKVSKDSKMMRAEYEEHFAPLDARNAAGDSWRWIDCPWPWELENGEEKR